MNVESCKKTYVSIELRVLINPILMKNLKVLLSEQLEQYSLIKASDNTVKVFPPPYFCKNSSIFDKSITVLIFQNAHNGIVLTTVEDLISLIN